MTRKKILICDDDEGILELLEMFFEDSGFDVIAEINSLNVVAAIKKENPDLVLLDLWMPVISGEQIIKVVREEDQVGNVPIVVMSASPDGERIAIAAGANYFIAKPFDMDVILDKVNSYLVA